MLGEGLRARASAQPRQRKGSHTVVSQARLGWRESGRGGGCVHWLACVCVGLWWQLSETFTSAEAARAMAILLSQRGLAVPGERQQGGARQETSSTGGACDLEAKTRGLQDRLKG